MATKRGLPVDEVVCADGFRFELLKEPDERGRTRIKNVRHITKDKRVVYLTTWRAVCRTCGAPFEVKLRWRDTRKNSVFHLRNCPEHRMTPDEVSLYRTGKTLAQHAALRSEALALLGEGHSVAAASAVTGAPKSSIYYWRSEACTAH